MRRKNSFLENIFSVRNDERNHKVFTIFGVKIKFKRKIKELPKIKSKDISVVVQGAVNKEITSKCLKSVRKYLPEAEIILSTWEGSDVEGLDYDKLVLNKDPGAYVFDKLGTKQNNNNRLILSTQQGLKEANRKYILKLRTDICLSNDNICKIEDNFLRVGNYRLFDNRVIVNERYSLKYEENYFGEKHWRPFHISDWIYFGKAKDIKTLFDIPLAEEPINSHYFALNNMPKNKFHRWSDFTWRFSPEQYITLNCAQKHFPNIDFKHILDYDETNIQQSEIFIINNFLILSEKDLGIRNLKPNYLYSSIKKDDCCKNGYYSKKMYLLDYQKYCDKNYILPFKYTWREDLHLPKYLKKFSKQWKRFFYPFKILIDAFCGLLGVIYYLLHILINLIRFSPKLIFKTLRRKNHDT